MSARVALSYVFEVLAVVLVGLVVWVNFGWSWALLPVAAYLLVLGVTVERGSR